MVGLSFQPVVRYSMAAFGGMSVDQVRLIAVHGDDSVSQTFNFSPDSSQIKASMAVPVTDTATFQVTIELLSGGTVMFTGQQSVLVSAGLSSQPTQAVELAFVGPGSQIAFIQIQPRDSGVSFSGSLPFRIAAYDSSENAVTQFYVAWSTGGAANRINANGVFRAGTTRGAVWVFAHTPTGIWDSTQVTVSPLPSQIVVVSGNGQSAPVGTPLPLPLVVKVLGSDNLPVAGATVTFATSSGGSVNPATAVTDSLGLAQTIATLGATAGTNAFTARVGGATQVQFTATGTTVAGAPANITKVAGDGQSAVAGTAVPIPPSVKVTDASSVPVAGQAVTFTVASGGGSVTGGSTTTNAAGIATVGSWTLGATPGSNALTASVNGTSLTTTFTATGTTAANAIRLSVPAGLVGVGVGGFLFVTLPTPAPAGGVTVTVTSDSAQYLTVAAPGTAVFAAGDTTQIVTINGVAPGVSILHATATGYQPGQTAVAVTPNFIVMQANVTVGIGQTTTLGLQVVPTPSSPVAITVASNDTTRLKVTTPTVTIPGGQSTGLATIQGVASGIVAVTAVANGYAIGATVVTVAAAATNLTLLSGGNQTATPGTALPLPIVVMVADPQGTGVSGYPVTFAVTSGGGSVAPTSATTTVGGLATAIWTLGPATGPQTMTATASGLAGSPLTISANAPGINSTVVSPKADTITAINGTFTLVAQAKDALGNNLTGSYSWTSRKPSAVAVNPLGVVTGLVNGDSAWVVATETGGTKDSAHVFVQQRLASIKVTPANKNLYLTTSFSFTASAVDGLGTPLPSNPAFNWSSTAPAVASVDTSVHAATNAVNALGLGPVQIRVTSGTITGVANVSVITAITRIAVVVDTVGAATPDTFSLPSLGVTRNYRAIAHDTLDAVMGQISQFTWASTNPSVASVPNQTSATVTATSAANGVTSIRATAQGFTSNPGAVLTVSQVLASIQLSAPASNPGANIAISGTISLVARGLDANSRYIGTGSYTYASSTPGIATVDPATGLVTGVANGVDTITASSGAITSNKLLVTVGGGNVPKVISFGRDTVAVGRGSTAQIPVLLSTPVPVGGPSLTVNLGASPAAYAHWSTGTVTIPVGGVSVNATLVGDSAGTTTVSASDGSALGYAAAGAVAKVTANMSFASTGYAINATDIVSTQVKLSDPSPAGGTYITFQYGTPGVAQVSPDPAYIPAGQLAADVQIHALAGGTTTITPNATGVNGAAANFTAYAATLTMYYSPAVIGLGQYDPNRYVYVPTGTHVPIPVTLASTDSTKASITPVVTIPSGSNYAYFTITGTGLGTATLSAAATGWTAANTIAAYTTTPHVGVCCSSTIFSTAGTQSLTVYAEDSLKNTHYRVNSLVVNVRSSDPSVMAVLDSTVTIPPGTYYLNGVRATPGAGGTAYLVVTASGHTPDSVLYTVNGPPLNFSWSSRYIGAGQQDLNSVYVYTPNSVTAPLKVALSNSDATKVGVPDTVTIPTGYNYVYFTVQGLATGGPVTIGATAPGFQAASATYTVTTPTVISQSNYTFNNFNAGTNLYVYAADTLRSTHWRIAPLVVTDSTDPSVLTIDSAAVTITAGQYYSNAAHIKPAGVGSARIVLRAAGQVALDSPSVTVNTPAIQFSIGTAVLGRRQHFSPSNQGFYIYTPDSRSVTVPVTLTNHSGVDTLTTVTPTIPVDLYYVYVDAFGLANGIDTLTVAATGYTSHIAVIRVSTPRLLSSSLPATTTTTNPPIGVNVYAADSQNTTHYTMDTVVVAAVSSNPNVIQPDSAIYHILKNTYYAQAKVIVVGPGSASITYSDTATGGYQPVTTNTVTVTGPALQFSTSSLVLGNRQTTSTNGIYVYTANSVVTQLAVHLHSTDTTVATVPDTVFIPAGSNYAYFPVNGRDTIGTVQVQATATGYSAGATSVQVTRPKFQISTSSQLNTTSAKATIYVYAEDANGSTHYTTEDVVVTLGSSALGVATVDSVTVTIPAGQYYSNSASWSPTGTVGTAQLSATDTRAAQYAYNPATFDVRVVTPSLNFSWGTQTLGIGQYNSEYVYTPDAATQPITVSLSHTGTPRTTTTVSGVAVNSVQIPTNNNLVSFHVVGSVTGMDTLVATTTSPVENPATGYTAVSKGQVNPIGNWPATLSLASGDSVQITLYAYDSAQVAHYVEATTTFTLAPSGSIQFVSGGANSTVITSIDIPKDAYYVQFYVKGAAQGTGQATISASNYVTYTTPTITVNP